MDKAQMRHSFVLLVLLDKSIRSDDAIIDHLRQIAIFAKTIDHDSFRGAANELRLSPSVVSHHISQLEDHLGVALLYRATRKLTLTREEERLLSAARNMLDAVESDLLDLTASASEPSGELRITAPSVLSQSPFTEMMAHFSARYPRLRITLDFTDSRKELVGDGFDAAIRMGLHFKPSPDTRKLFEVPRSLVAAPGFIALQTPVREPKDLRNWPWIELAPVQSIPVRFQKNSKQQAVHRKPAQLICNDAHALYSLARAGAGLAIVPEFLAQDDAAAGHIRYVVPDWQLAPAIVFAQWPPNAPKHGLIKLLVSFLTEARS
ncbi:LysR family transcriptional regulator [Leisingera sp. S132]|uniref:LysR family transcriptional regulator n=1 Tax=Leisingera sp. S132 TaxID=2867016 RepID=UPI0021A327C6|nr:LysR family transcriptional regulator [Leisingera sp. S132]UWQ80374.1 LysR family transcriptional regulator [Leisingera sp. S132]